VHVWRLVKARSCSNCCSRKAISITYSECVFVALAIQLAMRMRHIVIYFLPDYTIFFSIYLIKGTIFEKKKVIERKIYVLIFSTSFMWNILILGRIKRDTIIDVHRLWSKIPYFSIDNARVIYTKKGLNS